MSGTSLDRSFPHVDSALRLSIARHKFHLGHLFKLDATVKEKPCPKSFEILDSGELTQRERDASPKDYLSFRSLFDPLTVYFEILQYFIISSANIPAIHQVAFGCSKYICILYHMQYEWASVLQYHFLFHNCRLAEMHEGDYSGWRAMDTELASLYLYGNPRSNIGKSSSHASPHSNPASANAKQVCFAFQSGKCPSPRAHSQIHKCKICQSTDHGRAACTKKAKTST
ncbi:hypothetical protein K439DRAFT_1327663 [Ramaria rubella]|nr:hypothetical protein K439DRAFT_1327663 [Ramaria rubella]